MFLRYQKSVGFFVKYLRGIEKCIYIMLLWSELDGVASSALNLSNM